MPNILIIGATRGLGAALANAYAAQPDTHVFSTTREAHAPREGKMHGGITWVTDIDVAREDVGRRLADGLGRVVGGKEGFGVVVSCASFGDGDGKEGMKEAWRVVG